jgi:hypothetical protein
VPAPPVHEVGARGGEYKWLREAEDLPAYGAPPLAAAIAVRYPEDFHRRIRDPSLFGADKLLVSAKRSTSNPWRVKVGFDRAGLIPRETLYMIVPHDREDTELLWGLLAVFASSVAAAWVDAYSPTLSIPRRVITSLPVPSVAALRTLGPHGRTLAQAASQPPVDRSVMLRLEAAVWDAYELGEVVRQGLRSRLAGFRAPEGSVRFDLDGDESVGRVPARNVSATRRFGATLDTDEARGVKLWVPGLTPPEGAWHAVPERFLGWLAAEDATFDIRVRADDLHHAIYSFQTNAYRSRDQIAAEFDTANGADRSA